MISAAFGGVKSPEQIDDVRRPFPTSPNDPEEHEQWMAERYGPRCDRCGHRHYHPTITKMCADGAFDNRNLWAEEDLDDDARR
jgi:hypothetical protein